MESAVIKKLKESIKGQLIEPADKDYNSARMVWNGMFDKHPALIVRCADENDVIKAVDFARTNNLLVSVRGGGHNVAGFGTCDDGIVIDLSPMKHIEVDPQSQTAKAEAGLTWGEFDKATQAHSLATTGGLISETGVAGFTLGGGFGWLVRKYGFTVDNLLSVKMITAEGKQVTASPKENSDLFWGIKGGGGNFGIVTSFKFSLHPVGPIVYGGPLFYPGSKAVDVLHFYREWTSTLPDELSTMIAFLSAPPAPFVPKEAVGKLMIGVATCFLGSKEDGDKLLQPLREFASPAVDLAGPIPYLGLQTMFDEGAPKGIHSYWRTEQLNDLSDDFIDIVVKQAQVMNSLSPLSMIHLHHWEGAAKKINPNEGAFSNRDVKYVMNIIAEWTPDMEEKKQIDWVRSTSDKLKPFGTGQQYLNFLSNDGEDKIKAAYGPEKYSKLVALKNKYDPKNFFRLNQNIKPTA